MFDKHLDALAAKILMDPGVPCFIRAPRSSGRTTLALRYVQRHWASDDVHWLDGKAASFAQGVEAGTIRHFLAKRVTGSSSKNQLLIIDNLAFLEDHQAQCLSDDIDGLIEDGWRVLVVTTPLNDCLERLQSDRQLVKGTELLDPGHCPLELRENCAARFLTDELPLEMRLFAMLVMVLAEADGEELRAIGFEARDDLPAIIADLNPLFTCEKSADGQGCRLSLKGMPLKPIVEEIKAVLSEYHGHSDFEQVRGLVIEDLTRLSVHLLKRGQHARSHELLACLEAMFDSAPSQPDSTAIEPTPWSAGQSGGALIEPHEGELQLGHAIVESLKSGKRERPDAQSLFVRLFGRLEIYRDMVRVEHGYLSGSRVRSLLALLLLSPHKCVVRDMAIQQFWPEMDHERGVRNFHVACSRLKLALAPNRDSGSGYLLRTGTLYHLDSSLVTTDVDLFEKLAHTVLFGDTKHNECFDAAYEMERLHCDGILAGDKLPGALEHHRQRQHDLLIDALLAAARIADELGDLTTSLWFTRRAYDRDHSREDVYRALMDAQIKSGQRTSAIETYFACKSFLSETLGILPSVRTTALYQDLLLDRG
ncbi:MAG: hypothetical protein LBD25_08300 [Coriobacteriales bacterium]|nr:hypothetical protein [Coriobacteriales bacterium]